MMEGRIFQQWEAQFDFDSQQFEKINDFCDAVQRQFKVALESVSSWLVKNKNKNTKASKLRWVGLRRKKSRRLLIKDNRNQIHFVAITQPIPFIGVWNPDFQKRIKYPQNDARYFPGTIARARARAFPKDLLRYWMTHYLEPEELWQAGQVCSAWRVIARDDSTWERWRKPLLHDAFKTSESGYNDTKESVLSWYQKFSGRQSISIDVKFFHRYLEASIWGAKFKTLWKDKNNVFVHTNDRKTSFFGGGYSVIIRCRILRKEKYERYKTKNFSSIYVDVKLSNMIRWKRKRPIREFTPMLVKGIRYALGLKQPIDSNPNLKRKREK